MLLLTGIACDPGYQYRPVGWKALIQPSGGWSMSYGLIELQTFGISGIIGSQYISPEFAIRNRSTQVFVLEGAKVTSRTGS